jgi:type IV pilus assembly protein PilQ
MLVALFLAASASADEAASPGGFACGDEAGGLSARHPYSGERISFDFKEADIVNVLRMLSEIGHESIVITDDVKGRITLRLVDVPWDQALDIVLATNRLSCVMIGNVRGVSTTSR